MAAVDPIRIDGLRELQAALRAMDGETQKQLRVVFNQAAETVAGGARRRVPTRTGQAKASVRVMSSQREAKVVGGSRKAPYYPWLDFGGKVGRSRSVARPFVTRDRFLYPTYDASRDAIGRGLERALVDLCRAVGLEVD